MDKKSDRQNVTWTDETGTYFVALKDSLVLADVYRKRLLAEFEWFESLVDHAPSIGSFYEWTLASIIRETLPSNVNLGTGFVIDVDKDESGKQLDLISYRDDVRAPFFKRDNFVILHPSQVLAVGEVKKTLTAENLRSVIRSTLLQNMGSSAKVPNLQFNNIFAFRSKISDRLIMRIIMEELGKVKEFCLPFHHVRDHPHVHHLTLPQVYVFDRDFSIQCHALVKGPYIQLDLIQFHDQTLGCFLNEMRRSAFDPYDVDYLTHPLVNTSNSLPGAAKFLLTRRIAVPDLKRMMQCPPDRDLTFRGNPVLWVIVPAVYNLDDYSDIDELLRDPFVAQLALPNEPSSDASE